MTFLGPIYFRRPLLHNRAGQKCLNGRESFVKARKKWLLPIKLDGASFSPQECRQLYVGKKLTLRLEVGAVKGEIDCRRSPTQVDKKDNLSQNVSIQRAIKEVAKYLYWAGGRRSNISSGRLLDIRSLTIYIWTSGVTSHQSNIWPRSSGSKTGKNVAVMSVAELLNAFSSSEESINNPTNAVQCEYW